MTPPWRVPVSRLKRFANPLTRDPWGVGLRRAMIDRCIEEGTLLGPEPIDPQCGDPWLHAARIAWIVCNMKDIDPIDVDVGMPELGVFPGWPYMDGNHRLAAAIYRGDTAIDVNVEGSERYAKNILKPLCIPEDHTELDFA